MSDESCGVCGGDGKIQSSLGGSSKTCPACHGTGRAERGPLIRDVTKTKPSHFRQSSTADGPAPKPTFPTTGEGTKLGNEVRASAHLSNDTKDRLIREILEHEASHGQCTQTFLRKVRKQLRPPT